MRATRSCRIVFLSALVLLASSCQNTPKDIQQIARGVTFHRDREAGVQLLDVDVQTASVVPVIVAENIERRHNNFVGDCKTVKEWAESHKAIGGLNGGYFGDMYDQLGRRKQIVGLATVDHRIVAPSGFVESTRYPDQKFLRSVIGFTDDGVPQMVYATSTLKGPMRKYETAVNPITYTPWDVRYAVSCGPRLFSRASKHIADHEERLVSPGKLSRSFVAYDVGDGELPQHFVLGRADSMEFSEVADFLEAYFNQVHASRPYEAMCLDGGPSSQLVYRTPNGSLEDAEPTGVLVPTAILLIPK
jgi:hypothetical protein